MEPSLGDTAVWIGRYQPFHLGHVTVLRVALEVLRVPQLIGIVCYGQAVDLGELPGKDQRQYNPLTPWERLRIVQLSVLGEGLDRDVSALFVPYLPPERYHEVEGYLPERAIYCTTDKDDSDAARGPLFDQLGRRSAVVHVAENALVSSSKLRSALLVGAIGACSSIQHLTNISQKLMDRAVC